MDASGASVGEASFEEVVRVADKLRETGNDDDDPEAAPDIKDLAVKDLVVTDPSTPCPAAAAAAAAANCSFNVCSCLLERVGRVIVPVVTGFPEADPLGVLVVETVA